MIFQRSGGDNGAAPTILFVFVVGETPTGGLRIEQFQNALNIRRSMLADADPGLSEAKVLRIYGPAFSGSLLSLNAVLNAQPHDRFSTILIRSGTISSHRAICDFRESTNQEWPEARSDSEIKADHHGRLDFATFQFDDAYQEFYLSVFFRDRNHLHSHVALLTEDETVFGNQEARPDSDEKQSTAPSHSCQAEPRSVPGFSFVRLYFPREIAQLRDAYQREVRNQSAGHEKSCANRIGSQFGRHRKR
jgi:hypothetical protein